MSLSTLKENLRSTAYRTAHAVRRGTRRAAHAMHVGAHRTTRAVSAGAHHATGAIQEGVSQIMKSVRVEVDPDEVEKRCHTAGFEVDEYLVTRRDSVFPVTLICRSSITVDMAMITNISSQSSTELILGEQRPLRNGTIVYVRVPPDAAVGLYSVSFKGRFERGELFEVAMTNPSFLVVLFNPWSPNDGVYMEDERLREEYVSNTRGRVYAGDLRGMSWNLALYRPDCLRAVMFLIEERSKLTFEQRSSPVEVCREISALVNVQDDLGVLVGRWDGNYDDGHSPTFWRGSGEILQRYYLSKGEPVQYGQCWVFSGVLLSVLRILGIPSRSVTNFNSAHDTNRNRTIDQYYNENGDKVSYLSSGSESIWNFHVWNEAYMARPDLPAGFGGWQVLDATPQEESEHGRGYCTGPASVKAIKEGNSVAYDTNFIIAEVNADVKRYVLEGGVPRLVNVDTTSVGRTISTKAVGTTHREDITDQYKYPEGSEAERRALYHGFEELMEAQFEVDFHIPEVEHQLGENVVLRIEVKNRAKHQHRVRGHITCRAVNYTGKELAEVSKVPVELKVNVGKTEIVQTTVEGDIYTRFPSTKVFLWFDIMLAVHGTSQVFTEEVKVSPAPPNLKIMAPEQVPLGGKATAIVRFLNPLPVSMNGLILNIQSDQLLHEDIVHTIGSIRPNAEFSYSLKLEGLRLGRHDLVVGLESDKVELVTGEVEVEVIQETVKASRMPPTDHMEIESIDYHLDENRCNHHTNRYDDPGLIVRRGQSFLLTLTARQPLPSGSTIATHAVFQLVCQKYKPYAFEVDTVCSVEGKCIKIELKTPADVAVGEYHLRLKLDNARTVTVVHDWIPLTLLFNPWCSQDSSCYSEDPAHLEEYVLNNSGRIWIGTHDNHYGHPWQFGQYKKESLEVALYILDLMTAEERGDPIKVSRHISALVNAQDDNGVLVGNWSGDYADGTSPTYWIGSAPILAEYYSTGEPVCYGQCWVFSGVQTTLLRCVGIASRCITNFVSAHDTDLNRAVDKFYNEEGEEISSGDSIWNFHCWNEAYMARPDLPAGFGGWQVLDATPQEESEYGRGFKLGPAPRQAIKLGQRMKYDVEFVISEVNADIRYYVIHDDHSRTLSRMNTRHVGKNISTKAIGSNQREDITRDYKFEEGSTAERAALLAGQTESDKQLDVVFTVPSNITIGEDFIVRASVVNKGTKSRQFKFRLVGRAMLYTGAPGQVVQALDEERFTLKGGETKVVEMKVLVSCYLRILQGGNFISFTAMALVPKEKLSAIVAHNVRLKTPEIAVTLPPEGLRLHQAATIQVEFKNPLGKKLTHGTFSLHGEGYLQDMAVEAGTVGACGKARGSLQTIPVKRGSFTLVVHFTSDQLADLVGHVDTKVV